MLFDRARALAIAAVLCLAVVSLSSQSAPLSVTSAGPRGELAQLDDAVDIRIVFSEPMIALGSAPSDGAPSWIRITPAVPGHFYWSGTKTLIFAPDASTPLPFATTFTVRVAATAASVSGRALGQPYVFTFTTPTVQLLRAQWYRRDERFDRPAVIVLQFNQRVRTEDVVAHARVALEPHAWTAPALSLEARDHLRRTDPAGLQRFDAKVAAVRRVTSASSPVGIRAAESWNEKAFPRKPEQLVIETTTAPPPDAWLRIRMEAGMPSPEGPVRRAAHSTLLKLEPTFFVRRITCESACEPLGDNPIELTRPVAWDAFARSLTVVDVTDPAGERPVSATSSIPDEIASALIDALGPQDAGFDLAPAHTWRLRLHPQLQASDGQTLGYPWVAFLETMHRVPFIALDGDVWEASGGPRMPLNARNVQSITQSIAPVALSSVVPRLHELERIVAPAGPAGAGMRVLGMTPDTVQTHDLDVGHLLSSGGTGLVWVDLAAAALLPRFKLPPGTLYETVTPSGYGLPRAQRALLQVTNLGISVKASPQSILVFVTRLDTAAPVADARVTIVDADNQTQWRGTTDRDGVAIASALTLRPAKPPSDLVGVVTVEKDGDVAFVASNWPREAPEVAFRNEYGGAAGVLRGGVFTDRGVYKQREEIRIKAVMRDDTPSGMRSFPEGTILDVRLRDSQSREVDRRTIAVNRWSSAEWTWRVPDEAALGQYEIAVFRAGTSGDDDRATVRGEFRVAAFRRPDFRVDTTLAGDPPILGSTLRGSAAATFLFGAALSARPIEWTSVRTPVQRPPDAVRDRYPDARYAVGYMPDVSEPEQSGVRITGVLGADGRGRFPIETTAGGDVAYSYLLEADVEGTSGQHIANRAELVVHPASLYVAISRPPMFVDTKAPGPVGIVAVDLSGRAVQDIPVTVSLLREAWVPERPSYPGGWTNWVRREIPAGEWTVRTSAGETALPIVVAEGGSYLLRAIARDAAGRQTRTELGFYALGPGLASWHSEGNRINLVQERTTWKPGEKARILIQSPWPRATALLTVEREGIRSHRRFTITSTQDTVEVPITEADVPNVYVSVLLVKGRTSTDPAADLSAVASARGLDETDPGRPAYRVGYAELTVDASSKRLRVTVSADREEYQPRQPVTVSVAVAEPDGQPASSEVTLWAVDYGVLSLTAYTTPDVLKQIYVPKALQVETMDSRRRLMRRGVTVAAPVGGGGMSLETSSFARASSEPSVRDSVDAEVRSDFRPIVFWVGSATTDVNGRASTTVTLPDSVTTYRIMAVAGTGASHFGFGEREIRVTKPLTLLTTFPRFLAKGDRASFGAVVTNGGKDTGTAVVTVQSLDPATLEFGAVRQEVRLTPGASHSIKFDALATAAGEARVRITATLGGETDALEMPLTIGRPVRPETRAAYGETVGTAIERLALPPGVVPGAGGLTVELASTALVGLGESARYLDQYPYPCAEQKASRALALLLASDLGGAFDLPGIKPAEYRASAESALHELYTYQCGGNNGSGGFALWAGECGHESAYLTAYVLHVMKTARDLKVTLNSEAIDEALTFLERELKRPPPDARWWPVWAASQAYSVKVLTEFGRTPRASINQLAGMADRLPIFALSYLADALAASNDKGPRYQDVVRRLTNAIRIEADRAHVEEKDDDALAWLWNTNVRATAVVLDGLSRRKDAVPSLAPLVRWLVAARTDGRWGTTHENAMALEALVAYYRAAEPDVPRMTAAVTLGNVPVGSATFTGRSTVAQQILVSMPDLQRHAVGAAAPALAITRSGIGRVYYTARLQYVAPEPTEADDRGFRVERRYERYVKDGASEATTTFAAGEVIRVTVALTIRGEGRYLALTDPLPAGLEPLDDWSLTTASALAREATRTDSGDDWRSVWRGGYFDHVEKHDDRVVAFATRLGSGRHEFSYLVRATTTGTFDAPGARVEAMYAPELGGRSAASTLTVK